MNELQSLKLYHGTTATVAKLALKTGLLPRAMLKTKPQGNWDNGLESHPDYVYLTDVYAVFFASQAAGFRKWGIVELDCDVLQEANIYPDEDYLVERLMSQGPWDKAKARQLNKKVRASIESFKDEWSNSLRGLGTIAHRGPIPKEAITRIVLFKPRSNIQIAGCCLSQSVTIGNHSVAAGRHRTLTEWFLGKNCTAMEWLRFGMPSIFPEDQFESYLALMQGEFTLNGRSFDEYLNELEKALNQRDGVQVISRV